MKMLVLAHGLRRSLPRFGYPNRTGSLGCRIRRACKSDAESIERLWEGLFEFENGLHPALETVPFSKDSLKKIVEERLKKPDTAFFVAEKEGKLIGYVEVEAIC